MHTYHWISAFRCGSCGWSTTDEYQLTVINDILGACIYCEAEASASDFTIEGSAR
jgi:hypothetical protein